MKIQEISKSRISIKNQDENSHRSNLRLKIGHEPFYIGPKINENYMASQPSMVSQTEQNSQMDIPQFHSPTINESMVFSNQNQGQMNQEIVHNIEFKQSEQTENSTLFFVVQLIIWLMYFIGSMETLSSKITSFQIIDYIGNGISLVFVIYTIYSNKGLNSVSLIFHIWSIILTVTVLVYPQTYSQVSPSDKTFIKIINILRSLRLLFPLFNGQIQFEKIKKEFLNVYKLRKIIIFGLFWLFLVGLFYYQIFADSKGNRCRASQISQISSQIVPIDGRLCGRRQCPQNSFCTNPRRIGLQFNEQQNNSRRMQSNLYSFDSSIESMFSIFQVFTLNKWGTISQIYFDTYPSFISVPSYILGFIGFLFLMLALILIFLEVQKQEKQRKKSLVKKIKQNRISLNPQKFAAQQIKINISDNSINPLGSYKTFTLPNNQKEKLQQNQENKNDNSKIKVILYCLLIIYSMVHYILVSQFGLNPLGINQDLYNRKIGVALVIFFIIHFITLNLIKFEFLNQNEEEESQNIVESSAKAQEKDEKCDLNKQVTGIILKFEYFIFFMTLADYSLRFIEGKYLLQETSGFTSICHFLFGLRFYYIILALVDIFDLKLIKGHILLVLRTIISGLKFIKIFLLIACFLGLISFIIDSDNYTTSQIPAKFFYEINQIFMFLINHSWQSLYSVSFNSQVYDEKSLYVKIVGGICLFFGSVIFFTYYVSYLINEAFWNDKQQLQQKASNDLNNSKDQKNDSKKINPPQVKQHDDQETAALKQQKSFYIFPYDNILRQSALTIIKDKYYQQTIRFRFYLVYLLVTIIILCFCDDQTYGIMSVVLEGFIFLDILVTALALRFFGKFSYSQNKFFSIAHFLASIIMVIFSITNFQLHIVSFLQFTRFLLVFNYFQNLQKTLSFIQKLHKRFILHFLILIPILLGYTLISLLLLSSQNSNILFGEKLLESLKLSLILFAQKGLDLKFIIGQNNLATLFGQLSLSAILIVWIIFSLSFFCSLTGIIFSELVKQKICKEKQLLESFYGSNILLEELKIKEKIKKIRPKFDYHLYGSGFLLKLCTSKFFLFIKKFCCILCFICYAIVNVNLSTQQRVFLYSIHLFFFTIELLLFIIESFCYKCNQQYFWRDLVLNILAIPGSYIGFINPVRYSNQSYELKVILQLFNALTVLRFIKLIFYFQVFHKIYELICSKLSKTLHILALITVLTCSVTGYLYLVLDRKQPVFDCFNYAFLGLMGGDFHSTTEILAKRNQIQLTYQLHFLYLLVNLSTQIFYSLLIAFFIYQVSEVIHQQIPSKNIDFNLYNFNKYFHQNEFLNQWMKMDPQGKGFVNFKQILLKSHLFIRHFSVSTLPYKNYQNRIQTFKKLNLEIFEAQTIFQKEDEKDSETRKQYAIIFYDFLYALNKFVFKEINSLKLIDKGEYFIKNENYNEQPISFLNINSGAFETMMNGGKKNNNVQHKSEELSELWRKQSYSLVKGNIKERLQQHPQIEGINSVLKSTTLKSQDLYNAYRVKGKILRFLKQIKIYNLTKGNDEGFHPKK